MQARELHQFVSSSAAQMHFLAIWMLRCVQKYGGQGCCHCRGGGEVIVEMIMTEGSCADRLRSESWSWERSRHRSPGHRPVNGPLLPYIGISALTTAELRAEPSHW